MPTSRTPQALLRNTTGNWYENEALDADYSSHESASLFNCSMPAGWWCSSTRPLHLCRVLTIEEGARELPSNCLYIPKPHFDFDALCGSCRGHGYHSLVEYYKDEYSIIASLKSTRLLHTLCTLLTFPSPSPSKSSNAPQTPCDTDRESR